MTQSSQQAPRWMSRVGRVVAVCTSQEGGLPKYPQPVITMGAYGIEGDFHYGTTRYARPLKKRVPNTRQVTLLARETLEEMGAALGLVLAPGDLSENILIEGLGTLGDVPENARIAIGAFARLMVTGQNNPCNLLLHYSRELPKAIYGRRGLTAVVAAQGRVRPGDPVEIIPPQGQAPHQ